MWQPLRCDASAAWRCPRPRPTHPAAAEWVDEALPLAWFGPQAQGVGQEIVCETVPVRRDQLPRHAGRSFVLRDYKIVYVSTPKVACTSLKWMVAGIGGEDPRVFFDAARPGTESAIHVHRLWQKVPTLHEMSDDDLAGIDGDNGWHVFAMVRHPASRLWSAWQEKLLFRIPRMLVKTPARLVPALPMSTADVVGSFQRFVSAMVAGECPALMRDPHFRPQRGVLAVGRMPYTRVYTIDEMDQMVADLDAHVRSHGGDPVPPPKPRNETVLKPLRSIFTHEVQTMIRDVYAGDLRRWFRGEDIVPPGSPQDAEYPPEQLAEVLRLIETKQAASAS